MIEVKGIYAQYHVAIRINDSVTFLELSLADMEIIRKTGKIPGTSKPAGFTIPDSVLIVLAHKLMDDVDFIIGDKA